MTRRFVRPLTQEEREKLMKIAEENKDKNPGLFRKIKVILLSDQGKSVKDISKELGITKQAVNYIFKQFEKFGVDVFLAKKRGRRIKFTDEHKQKIVDLVNQFAPVEFGFQKNYWTLSLIVRAMKKIYDIKVSANTVRKILKDNGIELKAIRDRFKKRRLIDSIK